MSLIALDAILILYTKKNIDVHVQSCVHVHYRLKGAKNTIVRDYVLPDYTHIKRGYVKVGGVFDDRLNSSYDTILDQPFTLLL